MLSELRRHAVTRSLFVVAVVFVAAGFGATRTHGLIHDTLWTVAIAAWVLCVVLIAATALLRRKKHPVRRRQRGL